MRRKEAGEGSEQRAWKSKCALSWVSLMRTIDAVSQTRQAVLNQQLFCRGGSQRGPWSLGAGVCMRAFSTPSLFSQDFQCAGRCSAYDSPHPRGWSTAEGWWALVVREHGVTDATMWGKSKPHLSLVCGAPACAAHCFACVFSCTVSPAIGQARDDTHETVVKAIMRETTRISSARPALPGALKLGDARTPTESVRRFTSPEQERKKKEKERHPATAVYALHRRSVVAAFPWEGGGGYQANQSEKAHNSHCTSTTDTHTDTSIPNTSKERTLTERDEVKDTGKEMRRPPLSTRQDDAKHSGGERGAGKHERTRR